MMATTEGTTEVTEASVAWSQEASDNTSTEANSADFKERYAEVLGKVNSALEGVDWSQMGRIGKSIGILVAVIVAQILIKGVLDTINMLPLVPGLLELLGLVVMGSWGWNNLRTSTKREELLGRVSKLRQEYLG